VFGAHPKLLWIFASAEVWERFSYYGMRALLVLYLSKVLLLHENMGDVAGLSGLAKACGAKDVLKEEGSIAFEEREKAVQAFASQLYGIYTSLVYLTPLAGGILADQLFGQHVMIIAGGVLMAIGHGLLSMKESFLFGLLFIILGNGCFKPNLNARIGILYDQEDQPSSCSSSASGSPKTPRRDSGKIGRKGTAEAGDENFGGEPKVHRVNRRDEAFSIYYCAINLGAFFAPLVTGSIRANWGYGPAFSAAGIGMVVGLLVYVVGTKVLDARGGGRKVNQKVSYQNLLTTSKEEMDKGTPMSPNGSGDRSNSEIRSRSSTLSDVDLSDKAPASASDALDLEGPKGGKGGETYSREDLPRILALVGICLMAVCFWAVFEQQGNTIALFCESEVNRVVFSAEVPTEWVQSINPILILILTPFVNWVWRAQSQRGREPAPLTKMSIGCLLLAMGYGVLGLVSSAKDAKVSILWVVVCLALSTLGELYLSPVGLSFVAAVAPKYMTSIAFSFWLLASFGGNMLAGHLGTLYPYMSHSPFFIMLAVIALANSFILALVSKPLAKRLTAV